MKKHLCRSFRPFINKRSRVLVLGSMPGPVALRKQQYYGFNGNHFWTIIPALFKEPKPQNYREKIAMIRRHRLAIWDVIGSCTRPTAMDTNIRNIVPNKIPQLLKKFRNIRAVFINGQFAYKSFQRYFGEAIDRPVFLLPSTSPANAAMRIEEKIRRWSAICEFL